MKGRNCFALFSATYWLFERLFAVCRKRDSKFLQYPRLPSLKYFWIVLNDRWRKRNIYRWSSSRWHACTVDRALWEPYVSEQSRLTKWRYLKLYSSQKKIKLHHCQIIKKPKSYPILTDTEPQFDQPPLNPETADSNRSRPGKKQLNKE